MHCLTKIRYTGPVVVEPFSDAVKRMPPGLAVKAAWDSLNKIWPGP
jgi:hypothetical protein